MSIFSRIRARYDLATAPAGPVEVDHLICVCGLKRSGLHALSNWILAHENSHALHNNSPLKVDGEGSLMSRTVRTSPLPLTVRPGEQVHVLQEGVERDVPLPKHVDLLLVLFQSQRPDHLRDHLPLVEGIEAKRRSILWTLRDPFNWAASYMAKSQSPRDPEVWPELWMEYGEEFFGPQRRLPDARRVSYNRWFVDRDYRRELAESLGLSFTDRGLEVVTEHAGGSSFDQREFDAKAQQMAVLERWKKFADDPAYRRGFVENPRVIELAREIFDLSPELEMFSDGLR